MNTTGRLRFDAMRLAEALAERGELKRRIEQLGTRIVANARYQEGEEPAENAGELLDQLTDAIDRHALLIARINKTNTATRVGDRTLTDALAERDALQAPAPCADRGRGRGLGQQGPIRATTPVRTGIRLGAVGPGPAAHHRRPGPPDPAGGHGDPARELGG